MGVAVMVMIMLTWGTRFSFFFGWFSIIGLARDDIRRDVKLRSFEIIIRIQIIQLFSVLRFFSIIIVFFLVALRVFIFWVAVPFPVLIIWLDIFLHVGVLVEEKQPNQIDQKTQNCHNKHFLRKHHLGVENSFQGFNEDIKGNE